MKFANMKLVFMFFIFFNCSIMFVGCNNETDKNSVGDSYKGHIVYDISLENQWKYFKVANSRMSVDTFQIYGGAKQPNWDSVYYEIVGLLNFVIYENVILTFEYKIIDRFDETIEYIATYQLELSANGCGKISIPYTEIPNEVQNQFPYDDVGSCKRHLKLKSIVGNVIY